MSESSTFTTDALVQHVEWMRKLARQLVADADRAEDLAQEAWVVALERPPRDASQLRSWLGTVVSNLFRQDVCSGENRRAREAQEARPETLPPTDELVGRVHVERQIADLLLELEEPFRRAVLLRFYEGLPPREIARREEVSLATVKSRLHRGITKLRERLDRAHGNDGRAWVLAVLPLTREGPTAAVGTLGGLALNVKIWIAAGLVTATGTWFILRPSTPPGPPQPSGPTLETARALEPLEPRRSGDSLPLETESLPDGRVATLPSPRPSGEAPSEEPESPATFPISGRVLDSLGQPLDGVPIRVRGETETLTSTNGGHFRFETSREKGALEVADERWVSVRQGSWNGPEGLDPVLVLAPAIEIAGRVLDPWGVPLKGAQVRLNLPADFEARFEDVLDASYQMSWQTRSQDEGAFELERVPVIGGALLQVVHDRYAPAVLPEPDQTTLNLDVQLFAPRVPEAHSLAGTVLREDGTPASEARVALGLTMVRTDPQGRFVIDLRRAVLTERLIAVEAGSLPGVVLRPAEATEEEDGWPDFVQVRLGAEALSIRGRVLDARGEPIPSIRVWVGDPTPFGVLGSFPLRLEALMAGGQVPAEAIDSLADEPRRDGSHAFGSARPIFEPNGLLYWVTTEEDGTFELPGLLDREYVLHVLDEGLHAGVVSEPIRAGERGVELQVPAGANFERIRGRVVTRKGDPIPGVRITPWIPSVSEAVRVFGGMSDVTRFFLGEAVTSAEDGSFELLQVPREHVQFHLISDDIVPTYADVGQVDDPDDFEIEVLARVHLRIELSGLGLEADSFRVTSERAEPVTILEMRADGYSNYDSFPIVDGRSGVVTVTSDAAYLHLGKGGEIVETLPLDLRPGEVHILP